MEMALLIGSFFNEESNQLLNIQNKDFISPYSTLDFSLIFSQFLVINKPYPKNNLTSTNGKETNQKIVDSSNNKDNTDKKLDENKEIFDSNKTLNELPLAVLSAFLDIHNEHKKIDEPFNINKDIFLSENKPILKADNTNESIKKVSLEAEKPLVGNNYLSVDKEQSNITESFFVEIGKYNESEKNPIDLKVIEKLTTQNRDPQDGKKETIQENSIDHIKNNINIDWLFSADQDSFNHDKSFMKYELKKHFSLERHKNEEIITSPSVMSSEENSIKVKNENNEGSIPKVQIFDLKVEPDDGVKVQVLKADEKSLRLTLKPEGLGLIDIELTIDEGVINANILATEYIGKNFFENNLSYLLSNLVKEGINIGKLSVSIDNKRDESNSEKEQQKENILVSHKIANKKDYKRLLSIVV
ncbi:MAG: flagellar hook-length control protein FliK [Thermodesulfovibrionales bacterium]|nr:flagellar hook-length control protein FliK [Thermodesulfovibrionales bacterium]